MTSAPTGSTRCCAAPASPSGRVTAVAVKRIGVEIGFLSDTAVVTVTYAGTGAAPASLVVKLEPSGAIYAAPSAASKRSNVRSASIGKSPHK